SPTHMTFSFNPQPTTELYTLSLHDALPISGNVPGNRRAHCGNHRCAGSRAQHRRSPSASCRGLRRLLCRAHTPNVDRYGFDIERSEEHTSELQSLAYLVCRLLLEKKKKKIQ